MTSEPHPPSTPVTLSRRYPAAPLVGTAAIVFGDSGRVLLIRRGHAPNKGAWGLPGGLLDLGESLVDGVRREIREECAIEIDVRDLVAAFEPRVWDNEGRLEYHYVVLDYWAELRTGDAHAGDDAAEIAWANPDDLADYGLSTDTANVIARACVMRRAATV